MDCWLADKHVPLQPEEVGVQTYHLSNIYLQMNGLSKNWNCNSFQPLVRLLSIIKVGPLDNSAPHIHSVHLDQQVLHDRFFFSNFINKSLWNPLPQFSIYYTYFFDCSILQAKRPMIFESPIVFHFFFKIFLKRPTYFQFNNLHQ